MSITENNAFLDQVERVLASEELQGSEILRRLLKFLAEKSFTGEADELKEYTVAIDGLGKPTSYDPRHDSAVRIHVARLRKKLALYYDTVGADDHIIISVPNRSFRVVYERRTLPVLPVATEAAEPEQEATETLQQIDPSTNIGTEDKLLSQRSLLLVVALLFAVVLGALIMGAYERMNPQKVKGANISATPGQTPELEALWAPFTASKRPLIVAIDDPLFVRLLWGDGIYYRDRQLNDPKDIPNSMAVRALRKAMHDPEIQASQYYISFGELDAAFTIGKLLGSRAQNVSVSKASDLAWQQLTDNNILFVGIENQSFEQQMKAVPMEVPLVPVAEGILNLHPQPREPALYADQFSKTAPRGGVAYALVTHLRGPHGDSDVESFTCTHSAGYVAAVKAFVDPVLAREIVTQLRQSAGGKMPRYFQVLLKVQFKDEEPIGTTFVLAVPLP